MISARQIFPVVFLALAACAPPMPPSPFSANTGVVFPADRARDFIAQCTQFESAARVQDTWTPSVREIAEFEPILFEFLETQNPNYTVNYHRYYRQYAGFVVDDRRIIFVNGLSPQLIENLPPLDWRTQAIWVCDNERASIGVEYDVESGALRFTP